MADPDLACWILEFLLRQPTTGDHLAKSLLLSLPLPSPLPIRLLRVILLRRLASDISYRSISRSTLDTIELLHSFLPLPHPAPSPFAAAYAAVAAHLTASAPDFPRAAGNLWCSRILDLKKSPEASALVSDQLIYNGEELMEAVVHPSSKEKILAKDTKRTALESVGLLLKQQFEDLGPPFLEIAAKALAGEGKNKVWNEVEGDERSRLRQIVGKTIRNVKDSGRCTTGKFAHSTGESADLPGQVAHSTGEKVDLPKQVAHFTGEKIDLLPTPEVDKVKNALKSSSADLHKVVEDPLQAAIATASEMLSRRLGETHQRINGAGGLPAVEDGDEVGGDDNTIDDAENALRGNIVGLEETTNGRKDTRDDQDRVEVDVQVHDVEEASKATPVMVSDLEGQVHDMEKSAKTPSAEGPNVHIEQDKDHSGSPLPSLMDWNPTAHTYEWDDSIESASDKSGSPLKKPCLPSPKRRTVSPLRVVDHKKVPKRRKTKRWSLQEEDALRKAVQEHGRGNWKVILKSYANVFEERTEVDLKDKWRNMNR
ncbi:uncharacterized protein [Typha latifolia]|uniref:uncharacterized protein n=1 Tax=Typha latifolia TaxID=4733 RepID=UPI003C2DDD0B